MSTRKTRDIPARLDALRRRFVRWRATHQARSRIPDGLWTAAARLAVRYGLHRTSRVLRLEYYSLKKRLEQQSTVAVDPPNNAHRRRPPLPLGAESAATFLELSPASNGCECTVELEDAAGAKMRVHLKGVPMPDLAALSRSFWNPSP